MSTADFQLGIEQQVFMLFFAIFWGAVANVQPRWKAFHWPLFFSIKEVRYRVLLAVGILNLLPLLFFGYILWALTGRGLNPTDGTLLVVVQLVIQGVIPAFGIFGVYRIWLGILELQPSLFYKAVPAQLPEKRHVEPTYRHVGNTDFPMVDLGKGIGLGNLLAGGCYIVLASIVPWVWTWCDWVWTWFD